MSLCCDGYPIVVTNLPPEEGGGFVAYIPQLGSSCFHGGGDTAAEAIADLEENFPRLKAMIATDGYIFPKPLDWQRFQHMIRKEECLHSETEPPIPIICPDEEQLARTAAAYQFLRYRLRALPAVARVDHEQIALVYRAEVYLKPGQPKPDAEYSVYDLQGEFLTKYDGLGLDITVLEDKPSGAVTGEPTSG